MPDSPTGTRGAEYVYDALVDAGIDLLIEVPGHQTIPIDLLIDDREAITGICSRHETAIPHIAWGYHEAGGGVAATMSVPGPGDTNAMHGLRNALIDRVPLVHLTADVDPAHRGRGAIHELEPETLDNVVKENVTVTAAQALPKAVESGLAVGLSNPRGPVRFSLPAGYLEEEIAGEVDVDPERASFDAERELNQAASLLGNADRPVVFVGNGARRSTSGIEPIRELVRSLDVPVLTSYKGVGVISGDDPRNLGSTGLGLHAGGRYVLEHADVVIALGAYFDGPSTGFWSLPMGDSLIHVTAEPEWIDTSYEADCPIVGDIGEAARGLTKRLDGPLGWDGTSIGTEAEAERRDRFEALDLYDDRSPAPSAGVFRELREALPRETVATIDIGNFRGWGLLEFDFYSPETIVTPGYWTGMGVGLPAAIGAKLATPDAPVVSFVGDGCFLMSIQELHTAAEYDIDVTTIVLNNADYNIISQEETLQKTVGDRHFGWQSPDYAAIAEAFGCTGFRAETPSGAASAVSEANQASGPAVVDVQLDPAEVSPREATDYESTLDFH